MVDVGAARYPLAADGWGPEERAAMEEVVRSGRFTMGEQVRAFEREFAVKLGSRYAVMVNSGSSANLLATAALFFKRDRPLQKGDEAIVPCIAWSTTYSPLQQYGLRLRFVDVELDTLNLDTSRLEEALTPRTRVLVGVSVLGNPAALDVMRTFCDRHGLYFLEDNCESLGASLGGKACGTFGDLGTHSLFFSHHLSTMEGGMIVTDDRELYELAVALRAHGWTRDLPSENLLCQKRDEDFFEAYRFLIPGYNVRPLELCGAVGRAQLRKLDAMLERRRENAVIFRELFAGDKRLILQREHGTSSWFSFTVILHPAAGGDRKALFEEMKRRGIEYRIITGGNFLRHDAVRFYEYETVGAIVSADIAHDRGFFIGNFPFPAEEQIKLFREAVDAALGNRGR